MQHATRARQDQPARRVPDAPLRPEEVKLRDWVTQPVVVKRLQGAALAVQAEAPAPARPSAGTPTQGIVDEHFLRVLTEWSPLGIFHVTPEGQVDYANRRWCEISGVADHRDVVAIRRAVHPNDLEGLTAKWGSCLSLGQELGYEVRFVHPDGQVRDCATRATPVLDAAGKVTGFVGTLEDITERKRAAEADRIAFERLLEIEQLKEMDRFKTRLLNTASHELNTPITPLKLQLHMLKAGSFGALTQRQERAVGILDRNLDRLSSLVRDVLDVARLQSGQLKVDPKPLDLSRVIQEAIESFEEPAKAAGLQLTQETFGDLRIKADQSRLSQVLYNLLSNAIKFTPAGGTVHVRAGSIGAGVEVQVTDTGRGLEPSEMARLFQPFSQVPEATAAHRGTGLGLYISRGIVAEHGGTLEVESHGHGKGSTFRMRLPVEPPVRRKGPADTADAPQ